MDERSNVIAFPGGRRPGAVGWKTRGDRLVRRDRRRATVLFTELRGWRTITAAIGELGAETALSRAIDRALEALIEFDACDVTLDGERMQPVVSATFEGPDHPVRALRAAEALREAIVAVQSPAPAAYQFQACTGVNTGEIVDLELGRDVSLRSVGTLRSFAIRLQGFAGPGQVFLSAATYADVRTDASVRSLGEVRVNGDGEKQEAFALMELAPAAPRAERPTP